MSRVVVDTNILACAYDAGSPARRETARRALRESHTLVVSTQVLLEPDVVLARKLTPVLSAQTVELVVRQVGRLEVANADHALIEQAMTTAAAHELSV